MPYFALLQQNCCLRCPLSRPVGKRIAVRAWSTFSQPPPRDFDFRAGTQKHTRQFISETYPSLCHLLEQGALVVVSRPHDYVERRTDGYQEPEHIILVGTAHVSEQSADAVAQVIDAVQPDNVVVELCRSRSSIMQENPPSTSHTTPAQESSSSNPFSLSGSSLPEALWRSVRLGGGTQIIIRAAMAGQAAKIAKSVGLATGAEMRAAWKAAERVGAVIVLGDRPIEVTLQRAWHALTWKQKLQLGFAAIRTRFMRINIAPDMVESLKSDESISAFSDALSFHYPQTSTQLRFKDLVGLTRGKDEGKSEGKDWGDKLITGLGVASGIWWVASLFPHT